MPEAPAAPRRRRIAAALVALLAVALAAWLTPWRTRDLGALERAAVVPDEPLSAPYFVDDVTLHTTTGRRLSCLLRRPIANPANARLAAFLVSGGIRTGRRAVLAVDSAFAGIVMACDYPWEDPARLSWPRFLLRLTKSRGEITATPQALAIAATWLLAREDVDRSRFIALGASLGVPPVAAWAARDERPRAVALLYGGGDLGAILEANMARRIGSAWLRRAVAGVLAWTIAPLEPLRTVPAIAPRPLFLVASPDDARIPARSAQLLFDAAGEPKRILWLSGAHMRTRETELLALLTDSTLAWAESVLPGEGRRAP